MPQVGFEARRMEGLLLAAGILNLVEKARAGQWSAEAAIDWRLEAERPFWLPRAVYGQVISQLLQGERATIEFCRDLEAALPEGPSKRFVAFQVADEERHAEVLTRYLERQGGVLHFSKTLSQMHERIQVSDRPAVAKMIAYHAVLEGEAISLLQDLASFISCPLFNQIIRRLAVDEARHLAFGKSFLKAELNGLSPEEKQDLYLWVQGLWYEGASATLSELSGLVGWVSRRRNVDLAARWDRQATVLGEVGLRVGPPIHGKLAPDPFVPAAQ